MLAHPLKVYTRTASVSDFLENGGQLHPLPGVIRRVSENLRPSARADAVAQQLASVSIRKFRESIRPEHPENVRVHSRIAEMVRSTRFGARLSLDGCKLCGWDRDRCRFLATATQGDGNGLDNPF